MKKKPVASHTPTPWVVSENVPKDIIDAGGDLIARCLNINDAALIVKAVNAHKDLHDALELAEGFMSGFEDDETQENMKWMLATIRAALKKGA